MIDVINIILIALSFIYVLGKKYTQRVLCWFLICLFVGIKIIFAGKIFVGMVMLLTAFAVFFITELYGLSSEKFWEKIKEAENYTKNKVVIAVLTSVFIGSIAIISLKISEMEINSIWSTDSNLKSDILTFSFVMLLNVLGLLLMFDNKEEK